MANRPGDVLAGRYRLDDLLSESGRGRFWRGHDRVLARSVAIHVVDADDDRAPALLEAARASAQVAEPRLLRVLDIESDPSTVYVVNEWGVGTSLDHLVGGSGPLPPRLAAWVTAEVAAALESGHARGVAHGRLTPENVLVDTTGSVRLIGFAVEAALFGLESDRIGIDVVDLAGILHFALTGTWPGLSESAVPRSPREHHGLHYRVMRPRQVRAGVPRVLDGLCDEVLNRPHGKHAGPSTAREVREILTAYVGDPAGLPEELLGPRSADRHHHAAARALVQPQAGAVAGTAGSRTTGHGSSAAADAVGAGTTGRGSGAPTDGPVGSVDVDTGSLDEPTQAGAPVFDRDGGEGSGAWYAPRTDTPAPPPPLDPPPERPLFAPEPVAGAPARRTRDSGPVVPVPEPDAGPGSVAPPTGPGPRVTADPAPFWPFEPEPEGVTVPGRRWFRLGLALGLLVAVIVAGAVVVHLSHREDPPASGASPRPSAPSTSAPAALRTVAGARALDFDPQGDPPTEYRELAPLAVDGDPATSWHTSTYREDLGPGGLKSGVGLVIDLQRRYDVGRVDVGFDRAGAGVSLYVSDTAPTSVDSLGRPVATSTGLTGTTSITLREPVAGRFVTVWLTSLPRVSGGYRAAVSEVSVAGAPASADASGSAG